MSEKQMGQLGSLSPGETLFILRRRRGERQVQAAASCGVSRFTYGQWECDKTTPPESVAPPEVEYLKHYEICVLYRRRAGKFQRTVAKEMGYSKFWINQMEHGRVKCDALIWYWEQ